MLLTSYRLSIISNLSSRIFLTALIALFLTACGTVSAPPVPTTTKPINEKSWKENEARLNRIQNWAASGKIAVRTARDSGTASVEWRENHGHYNVALSGPLGAGAMTLRGGPGSVTLYMADGKRFSASSPEQLLAEKWGFNLPVSNMKYWIKGVPVPGVPYHGQFDANNRLATLTQAGCHIQYSGYTRQGNFDLPERVAISSPQLKTKIVIYNWKIFG